MERHLAQRPKGEVIHMSTAIHKRKRTKKKRATTAVINVQIEHVENIQVWDAKRGWMDFFGGTVSVK
jgi:hypothetical protein